MTPEESYKKFKAYEIYNLGAGAITPSVIMGALIKTGLHWEMSPAQIFSLEINSLYSEGKYQAIEEKLEDREDSLLCEIIPRQRYTLCGLPVSVRADYPEGWVSFVDKDGRELIRFNNCAIPSSFADWQNFDAHQKNEERKAEAICHARPE